MSSREWVILLVSALTDFILIATGTLGGAMMAGERVIMPTTPVLVLGGILGLAAFARTVQQGLKSLPAPSPVKE